MKFYFCSQVVLFQPSVASTPVQLCLACLPGEYLSGQAVSALTRSIQPQPCIAILSGTCTADQTTAWLGDIAVIRRDAISAELQHMTELWRLQEKALWLRGGLLRERRPRWSFAEQSLVLARLYLELNVTVLVFVTCMHTRVMSLYSLLAGRGAAEPVVQGPHLGCQQAPLR